MENGQKLVSKRIMKEYNELLILYDLVSIEILEIDEINKKKKIIIYIQKQNTNIYKFIINENYPFTPPKIFINDDNYNKFLNLRSLRFNSVLKYMKGYECLCCKSIICQNNWSPGYTIKNLINEIDNNKKIKQNIFKKLLIDQIKMKYLNSDIDIESWLFELAERTPSSNII